MKVKMKRLRLIILTFAMLLSFTACDSNSASASNTEYASQEAFLKDMAKGISNRLKNVDDEKQRSDEEKFQYLTQLVTYELEQIEAYEDLVFEDELFNELAHGYISACKMQLVGAQNYKNSNLYNALWNGGSTIRNGIICELYSRYNLPITSEEASNYSASGGTVSYTISTNFNTKDYGLTQDDFVIVNEAFEKDKYGYNVEFKIRNETGYTLDNLGVKFNVYDRNYNALDSFYAWSHTPVDTSKTAILKTIARLDEDAKYVIIEYFLCESEEFPQQQIDVSDKFAENHKFVVK